MTDVIMWYENNEEYRFNKKDDKLVEKYSTKIRYTKEHNADKHRFEEVVPLIKLLFVYPQNTNTEEQRKTIKETLIEEIKALP